MVNREKKQNILLMLIFHSHFITFHHKLYNLKVSLFVADEITLHIPELDLEPEVDVLRSDPEMVDELEQCVMNWQTQITVVIEEQQNKKPQVCDSPYILSFSPGRLGGITVKELLLQLKDSDIHRPM